MNNFLIVGTQRTGSSALAEMVGLHPEVACGWEWTLRTPAIRKLSVAKRALSGDFSILAPMHQEHLRGIYRPDLKWLGFRRLFRSSNKWFIHPTLSPALLLDRLEGHINWLKQTPDIHIIHVRRTDDIAWLASKFLSKESNSYWGNHYPEGMKVNIPLREAVSRVRSKKYVDARLASIARSNPYIAVTYEDFLKNAETVSADVLRFLSCDPNRVTARRGKLRRQSKGPVADYIENYDALVFELNRHGLAS